MSRSGVGHHAHHRLCERRQILNLARVVGPHLDHCRLMLSAQPQQREGHTDVVVQIAAGGQHLMTHAQDCRDHLFDSGLTVAAGDTDDGYVEALPPRVG